MDNMKFIKYLLPLLLLLPIFASAQQTILPGGRGGTGFATTSAGNIGNCLSVSSNSPLVYTFGACAGGSISGGTAGMLTSWLTNTTLTATGTPTAASYFATSTTATSTFMGGLQQTVTTDAAVSHDFFTTVSNPINRLGLKWYEASAPSMAFWYDGSGSGTNNKLVWSDISAGGVTDILTLNRGGLLTMLQASSTYFTATNLWEPGQSAGCAQFDANAKLTSTGVNCGTGSGSGADPFTHTSVYGQTTSATSSLLALTGSPFSLVASSTVNFVNASTTNFTVFTNEWHPGLTASKLLALDNTGMMISSSTIGWNVLKGAPSSIFAFDQNGAPTATTSIGNSLLPNGGILTVNTSAPLGGGGAVTFGGTLTLTCATCITSLFDVFTHPFIGYSATTSVMQIGTSTPGFGQLTVGSSTAPQFSLSDNTAADQLWAMRSISGNFFLASSTAVSTSTIPAMSMVNGTTTFSDSKGFTIADNFNTGVVTAYTASSTAGYDLLELWSATSTGALFGVDQYGHVFASSTAPVLSTCGTTPSISSDSSDYTGTITVGSVAATACTLSFGTPHTVNTHCVISEQTGSVVNASSYTESLTGFTYSQTGLTSDKLDYICTGK